MAAPSPLSMTRGSADEATSQPITDPQIISSKARTRADYVVADVPLLRAGEGPEWRPKMPVSLSLHGVTEEQFKRWMDLIDESQRKGNAFGSCPAVGLCYWCCPLLCLQPLVCMANPCTWWMSIKDVRQRDTTEDCIRSESPDGLHFKWTLWQHAVWEQNTLHELRLEQPGLVAEPPPVEIPPRLLALGATQHQCMRSTAV